MPDLKKSWGWQYWQRTKFKREELPFLEPLRIGPETKKKQKFEEERSLVEVEPEHFLTILQKRRSFRKFKEEVLSSKELSYVLYAAYGITGRAGFYSLKTAPSAGALYPCQIYVVVNRVENWEAGVYFFNPDNFSLGKIKTGNFAESLAISCLNQSFIAKAGVNIVISAVFRRNMIKYGHRGLRYILLDAGHIAQNILLAATNLGLGSCPVGAFFDEEVDKILDLDGEEESSLYLISVGKR